MKKYDGNLIYHVKTPQGDVEVVDAPPLRTLHFGTPIIQSSMYLDNPFALEMEYNRVMMLSLLFKQNPKQALFLGLGGGSKPKFVWKYFAKCQIDAIEFNPAVIEVCKRFFDVPNNDPRFLIYSEEASFYLNQSIHRQYDLIFVDLYVESGMSKTVGEKNFFELCFQSLKPDGILIWNLWRTSPKELVEESVTNLSNLFKSNLLILPIQESLNFIFMAFKPPIPKFSIQEITSKAHALTKATSMDFVKTLSDLNYFKGHGFIFQG